LLRRRRPERHEIVVFALQRVAVLLLPLRQSLLRLDFTGIDVAAPAATACLCGQQGIHWMWQMQRREQSLLFLQQVLLASLEMVYQRLLLVNQSETQAVTHTHTHTQRVETINADIATLLTSTFLKAVDPIRRLLLTTKALLFNPDSFSMWLLSKLCV
jgi:hypothetical protein